jgi:membrane protein implicated in regulation of membrane protease activity
LITTRKFLNSWLKPKSERTNLDRVIGASALVTEPISKNKVGEVKVLGKYWSAISESDHSLGEEVIVDAIDGVKLIVRKKDE